MAQERGVQGSGAMPDPGPDFSQLDFANISGLL